jgi:hypothetical protein
VQFPFFVVTVVVTVDVDEIRNRFPERLTTRACESQKLVVVHPRVAPVVHVDDYVHGYVQNGICTRFS